MLIKQCTSAAVLVDTPHRASHSAQTFTAPVVSARSDAFTENQNEPERGLPYSQGDLSWKSKLKFQRWQGKKTARDANGAFTKILQNKRCGDDSQCLFLNDCL